MTAIASGRHAGGSAVCRPVPGDGLLHPASIVALALLIANDHWMKSAWPGLITGKLSDVAGLVVTPLLLGALIEVAISRRRSVYEPSAAAAILSTLTVGCGFTLAITLPAVGDVYRTLMGALQWPFEVLSPPFGSTALSGPTPVQFAADPTDLLTLPALIIPLWVGLARARHR